jgi:hypothetical protein
MSEPNDNSLGLDNLSDDSPTTRECTGFTQINNNVINNIKDGDAFLVWCYLYSKTPNWKTIKQNIRNVYGFGDAKIKKIFSYLRRANLIEYVQNKCAKGQYQHVQIRILNGKKFDKTQAWLESAPHVQKPTLAEVHTNGNEGLRNTDNTKDINKHNTKDICATDVARQHANDDSFENYWKINPVKKNKIRAKRIWDRKKLYKIELLICDDVKNRLENDSQWQNCQYIPHPSTYLQNELWNDEITPKEAFVQNKKPNGGDSLSRVINKYLSKSGVTYDQHGNTIDSFR